jgi:hypothetical protein
MTTRHLLEASTTVDFSSQWATTWATLSSAIGTTVVKEIATAGTLLMVGALLTWLWERRKGGGTHSKLLWTALIGAVAASPILIQYLLIPVDGVVNGAIRILGG